MEPHKRDNIYDELDQLKIEYEKLREECRAKAELSDYLKKSQHLQISKIQHAKSENDKLVQELNAKSEEMCEIKQMYEDLQSNLHRKDLFLQQLSSTNEKIRAEHGEKILKIEIANKDLVLALDEASARIHDLERKTATSDNEIASLKRIMSLKPEKGLEVQKNETKDIKKRDLYIFKLEEECRTTKDQLKWKTEQFTHLEEAYGKLQTHFQANKLEWQKEKSALVDEISSLQASLDAQFRVSESLEAQLRICNKALSHEESRRKTLEIELSESRSRFEHVLSECQVAKSEVEQVTIKREEDIADLRTLLQKKDILSNEMKYRIELLEQENSDFLVSIKNIQQGQLDKAVTSSSSKTSRKKLHDLQQLHKKCEAEWSSQMEKLNISLEKSRSALEDCHLLLEVKNEEIFLLVLIFKAEIYAAYSKLSEAQEKSDYTDSLKQKANLEEELKRASEALEIVNSELADKTSEHEKSNLELLKSKSEVENLKVNLEEIQNVQENARQLHEQIRHLEAMIVEKSKASEMLNQDREKYKQIAEDRSFCIETLQNEISQLKNDLAESKGENFDLLGLQKAMESENTRLLSNIDYLLLKLETVSERMELFCRDDIELMGSLGKMFNYLEESGVDDAILSSSSESKLMNFDERTPLTELNSYI